MKKADFFKKVAYLDLDGVLANFDKAVNRMPGDPYIEDPPEMFEKGFFRRLELVPGSKAFVNEIMTFSGLDVFIASKPSTKNIYSVVEKYEWVEEHFPELLKKIFLVCDKSHLIGHYLIDDDIDRWGKIFPGTFLHFDPKDRQGSFDWILEYLKRYK